jgi:hypothetical protein
MDIQPVEQKRFFGQEFYNFLKLNQINLNGKQHDYNKASKKGQNNLCKMWATRKIALLVTGLWEIQ